MRTIYRRVLEIGIFSAVINSLLLVMPLYLLQVYDRVIPTSSQETLLYLSIAAVGSLLVMGALEVVRGQVANRLVAQIDKRFGSAALLASLNGPRAEFADIQPLRDLSLIRNFAGSRAFFFPFDFPFAPLFIFVLYFVHPYIFYLTVAGVLCLVVVAILNQLYTGKRSRRMADTMARTMNTAQSFTRNYEALKALGMLDNTTRFWGMQFADGIEEANRLAAVNAWFSGISRCLRIMLQIAILGVGGLLVIRGEMSAGVIFASSIISGRAMQPIDQLIGSWRQMGDAWNAWKRVAETLKDKENEHSKTLELSAPKGGVGLEKVVYFAPNAATGDLPVVKRVSLKIPAGQSVVVVGASGAGKSTLVRLMTGAICPRTGTVRLDGADIRNWDSNRLGKWIGYVPQEVELFPASVAENIARLDPDFDSETVMQAARSAHVHDFILAQKLGYETRIGPGGVRLSGGERQRIGMARALYGDPKLLILDEPNAHLDADGELALEHTLAEARSRGITVIMVTHKARLAIKFDRMLIVNDGQIEIDGPPAGALRELALKSGPQRQANGDGQMQAAE